MSNVEAWFQCTLGEEEFLVRRVHGREELGRLPEYRVELMRSQQKQPVALTDLLGTQATIKLKRAREQFRYVNGWISSVDQGGAVGRFDLYRIELRPWLWHCTLGADCKIFQEKTAVEIIEAVFADYSSAVVDTTKLSGTRRKRPYCVQYRESDFAFVSRLMEEEGIWYWFEHVEGRHTLVLGNSAGATQPLEEASLSWAPVQAGDVSREDLVTRWRYRQQVRSLKFAHDDHDHESPTASLLKTEQRTTTYRNPADLEVYDWPGRYAFPGDGGNATQGAANATLAVNRFETGHRIVEAATPCRSIAAGRTFNFVDHPQHAGGYLVTGVVFEADFGDAEATRADRGNGFSAQLRLVPQDTPFANEALTPKPIVRGPQTAVVVGPSGDEIHVDRLGRIKVWFRWDRVGPKNERSTCFIRVATPWASKGYGMISTPRIGDEVVVSFLEGDPDRPLVTGSVYNGDQLPPYELPAQATVSGIRSRSSSGGGAGNFNELRFDDKKGSEYVWFQAEKDLHRRVKNDATDEIGRDSQLEIGKNHTASVGEAYDLKIGKAAKVEIGTDASAAVKGDLKIAVDGDGSLKLGGGLDLKTGAAIAASSGGATDVDVGGSLTISAGGSVHIKATAGVVIDGGVSIALKVGGTFITLDPSGVSIVGPMVKNNSGGGAGAAGKAKAASPSAPDAPAAVTRKEDPLP